MKQIILLSLIILFTSCFGRRDKTVNSQSFSDSVLVENNVSEKDSSIFNENNNSVETGISSTLKPSRYRVPYSGTINPETVEYETIQISMILGIDRYSGSNTSFIRYIPLLNKDDISIILVTMDEGDFFYNYYLLSIKDNNLVSALYVEGEWWEPESDNIKKTSFTIDEDYVISVTSSYEGDEDFINHVNTSYGGIVTTNRYYIDNNGEIVNVLD